LTLGNNPLRRLARRLRSKIKTFKETQILALCNFAIPFLSAFHYFNPFTLMASFYAKGKLVGIKAKSVPRRLTVTSSGKG